MKEFDAKTIGKNIEKRRKALGLSQTALSNKTGGKIPSSSICRYEKGTQKPGLETIYYFAQALGCSIDELVTSNTGKYAVGSNRSVEKEEEGLTALAMLLESDAFIYDDSDRHGGCFHYACDTNQVSLFLDEFMKILSIRDTAGDSFESLKQKCIEKYAQKWREEKYTVRDDELPF